MPRSTQKRKSTQKKTKSPKNKPSKKKSAGSSAEDKRIKEIQDGKTFALDTPSVLRIFKAALEDMNGDYKLTKDVKTQINSFVQDEGVKMAKRAYQIDQHKRKDNKTITGSGMELAFSICFKRQGDQGDYSYEPAFMFAAKDTTPSLKKNQIARLIKVSVPKIETSKGSSYMKVSKDAKDQLETILTIYIYELAKKSILITGLARRKTIKVEDLIEGMKVES